MKTALLYIFFIFIAFGFVRSEQKENIKGDVIECIQLNQIEKDCILPVFNTNFDTNYSSFVLCKIIFRTNPLDLIYNKLETARFLQNNTIFLANTCRHLKLLTELKRHFSDTSDEDRILS